MAAELDIPVLVKLSNCHIFMHDSAVAQHFNILTARTLTTVNPTEYLSFGKKKLSFFAAL